MALIGIKANAQTVSISPAKFTAEDEITITVDVTGTTMAGIEPVYLWTWSNLGDGPTNGSWGNSSESAALTKVSTNVWKVTFVPATFYNASPAELKIINFLFKSKTGTAQTKNFEGIALDPLTFTETQFRSFPSKGTQNDIVTVYMTKSLAPTEEVQRMTKVNTITLKAYDGSDSQIGSTVTQNVDSFTSGIASFGFIPTKLFTGLGGVKVVKVKFTFNGKGLNENGVEVDVTSNEGEVILLDLL